MLPKGTLREAQNIRRSLVNARVRAQTCYLEDEGTVVNYAKGVDLGGACGLASVLLCLAVGDTKLRYLKGTSGHCWNEFDGLIVDITATQFAEPFPLMEGVCVTRNPAPFHTSEFYHDGKGAYLTGYDMLDWMIEDEWYVHPRRGASPGELRRWRNACAQLKYSASSAPMARLG